MFCSEKLRLIALVCIVFLDQPLKALKPYGPPATQRNPHSGRVEQLGVWALPSAHVHLFQVRLGPGQALPSLQCAWEIKSQPISLNILVVRDMCGGWTSSLTRQPRCQLSQSWLENGVFNRGDTEINFVLS